MTDAVGLADVARVLGIAPADVATLERDGLPVIVKRKRKFYRLSKVVPWYVDHRLRKAALAVPPRVSKKEFANLLGVTTRQITNLDEQGLSSLVDGNRRSYVLPDSLHWYINWKAKGSKGGGSKATDLDVARLKKIEVETQHQEIALLKTRGELIDRLVIERLIGDLLSVLKGEMLNFAARWGGDLVNIPTELEARQRLKAPIAESINRLSAAAAAAGERVQLIADGEDRDSDDGDAAAADDETRDAS